MRRTVSFLFSLVLVAATRPVTAGETLGQHIDEASIPSTYLAHPPAAPLRADVYTRHYGPRSDGRDGSRVDARCRGNGKFLFAAGMFDITGPAWDQEMAGYADAEQISEGIHNRQWARAFAIESPCNGNRVMLVSIDQGLMFHAVKQGVIDLIETDPDLGGLYSWENVLITPTHSHMTAAGQAHHDAFNFFAYGHDAQSYEALVTGIYAAIQRAHDNLSGRRPGRILFNQGELLNATVQRSMPAYLRNPEPERARWVDRQGNPVTINRNAVSLLLQRDGSAAPVGMLNWFPIHGTSMGQHIRLLSGDNKGYAAWRYERVYDVRYLDQDEHFVAGFFQADEGDNSPNIQINNPELLTSAEIQSRDGDNPNWQQRGGGRDDYESTLISGTRQYLRARELAESASQALKGGVHFAHAFIDMYRADLEPAGAAAYQGTALDTPFTRGPGTTPVYGTCEPAYGVGFAAGAEDGRGPFAEGQTCAAADDPGQESFQAWFEENFRAGSEDGALPPGIVVPVGCNNPAYDALGYACHAEKPIAIPLAVSPFDPEGQQALSSRTVPMQLITIGNLAIIGLSFEVTTMSGRRIRDAVLRRLAPHGIDYAVISGLSNNYNHYLTTREEYASQQYEGASTIFGPWTQEVVRQELEKLAGDLLAQRNNGTSRYIHMAGQPYRTHRTRYVHQPDTADNAPLGGRAYGELLQDPGGGSHAVLEAVNAVFVARNPRADFRQMDTYMEVERENGAGGWESFHIDNDWSTRVRYGKTETPLQQQYMTVTLNWVIPPRTPPGNYRLVYRVEDRAFPTGAFAVTP